VLSRRIDAAETRAALSDRYYLMISLGGAVGGAGRTGGAVRAARYFELAIGLVACALLLLYQTFRITWRTMLVAAMRVA